MNSSRTRDDMFLHLAIELEGWRCTGRPSLVRLQGSVVDGLQSGVDPPRIKEIDLGKLRGDGSTMAYATELALITHSGCIVCAGWNGHG